MAQIAGIKHMIAVASGKGGVGKSTTAVNLALGLQAIGLKAGILDADIYGPSQPRLLGLSGRPQVAQGKTLKPMEAYGLRAMSMGFLVDEGTPIIWRGPMVVQALTQMLREVAWGEIDILVIDMPPGTGDVQLTIAAAGAAIGRHHRLDTAGPGADRRPQGPQHVPQGRHSRSSASSRT